MAEKEKNQTQLMFCKVISNPWVLPGVEAPWSEFAVVSLRPRCSFRSSAGSISEAEHFQSLPVCLNLWHDEWTQMFRLNANLKTYLSPHLVLSAIIRLKRKWCQVECVFQLLNLLPYVVEISLRLWMVSPGLGELRWQLCTSPVFYFENWPDLLC